MPIARVVVADDPDGLLAEAGVQAVLAARGQTVVSYADADPMAFRLQYERDVRGGDARLVVRADGHGDHTLPYDVLAASVSAHVSLSALFPTLHVPTLAALPLDALDAVEAAGPPTRAPGATPLGTAPTAAWLLRRVYSLDPEALDTPEALLAALARHHYRAQPVPPTLAAHLVAALAPRFEGWALDRLVADRSAFLAFLQERWPLFVDAVASGHDPAAVGSAHDPAYGTLAIAGPAHLPLGHEDVRVYLDTLFLEGYLRPVPRPIDGTFPPWMATGLQTDATAERTRRLRHLTAAAQDRLPEVDAPHAAWAAFAALWAELRAVATRNDGAPDEPEPLNELARDIDARFRAWLVARYRLLRTQPPRPPAMVHHIAPWLAARLEAADGPAVRRVALVVLDGLSMAQWVAVAPMLAEQLPGWSLDASGVFAWAPTVTEVSRHAIFAGSAPHDAALGPDDDGRAWARFWAGRGLLASSVAFRNVRGDSSDEAVDDVRVQALGLVVRKTDEVVHGAALGLGTALREAQQWIGGGWLARRLLQLAEAGFDTAITSDHGHVEAVGLGRPPSGVRAAGRGERARVYDDDATRARDAVLVPGALAWTPAGLPPGYHPLFAPHGAAFTTAGKRLVAHGGVSLDEVVVPLVHVHAPPTTYR